MPHMFLTMKNSLLCGAFCALLAGCSLVNMDQSKNKSELLSNNELTIPETTDTSFSSIDLEVVILHRTAGDPLVEALWDDVDQIGALDPHARNRLLENGIKIGQISTSYPMALETLLGLTTKNVSLFEGTKDKQLHRTRISRPSGKEAIIEASELAETRTIRLPLLEGEKVEEYTNARCVLRVTPEKMQDGWVKIEVQPEIHHGQMALRHQAAGKRWTQQTSQEIIPVFSQKFELNMNLGEIAVFTYEGDDPESLGHHFFRNEEPAGPMQRLVLVRLADIRKENAVLRADRQVQ